MTLKRFGVSIEDELLVDIDKFTDDYGFANRSQAIRFLIKKNITEQKWKCNNIVAGAIIIIYDLDKNDILSKMIFIQKGYTEDILSSSQYHISKNFCMYVVMARGEAYRLTELSDNLTTIKGIKHGKLVMSRAD
jgi:CopG family nickel-responsive transcriptional regulator